MCHPALDGSLATEVNLGKFSPVAQALGQAHTGPVIQVTETNHGSLGVKRLDHRLANAISPTGYEHQATGELVVRCHRKKLKCRGDRSLHFVEPDPGGLERVHRPVFAIEQLE